MLNPGATEKSLIVDHPKTTMKKNLNVIVGILDLLKKSSKTRETSI